jgi:hypothetical protein
VDAATKVTVGGSKYDVFEIEPGIELPEGARLDRAA